MYTLGVHRGVHSMAKAINRLTALKAGKLNKPGFYFDGNGLYLQVSPTCSKSWVFRYKVEGRQRKQGLGSFPDVSLELARQKATASRELKRTGIDPIDSKKEERAREKLAAAKGVTFRQCAVKYIDSHKAGWKNRKHEAQWRNTLSEYAYPLIGDLPIQSVDVGLVLQILEPIWIKKTETATRVRQRIENICDWAKAREYREGENPARWKGHLDNLLPNPTKIKKVKHFVALHYSDMPDFYDWLEKNDSLSAKALQFIILTATRNGEARRATTDEIDLAKCLWVIPDERMKASRTHRVPLSKTALRVLKEAKLFIKDSRIFPGQGNAEFISETALLSVVKQYRKDLTVHGFRSTFRDWCAEVTTYPREVAEVALAHSLKDATEAAYQRGDLLEKRAGLMDEWAKFCTNPLTTAKSHQ